MSSFLKILKTITGQQRKVLFFLIFSSVILPLSVRGQSLARVTGNSTRYIDPDGKVWVCGEGTTGSLGTGNQADYHEPVDISGSGELSGKTIVMLAAGDLIGLALDDQGVVYSWGQAAYGKLGNGQEVTDRMVPGVIDTSGVLSGKKVVYIASATQFCFAITDEGKLYSWGRNYFGTLGDGTGGNNDDHNTTVPVAVDSNGVLQGKKMEKVSAYLYHVLALDVDGRVYGWGLNEQGQIGDGTITDSHVPAATDTSGVLRGKKIIDIATGSAHSLALDTAGVVYAWGANEEGQLGDGTSQERHIPVVVDTNGVLRGKKIVAIAAGWSHNLAVDAGGVVYAWGANDHGQLGNNTTVASNVPVVVDTSGVMKGKKIVAVSCGYAHSMAMDDQGVVYTWGLNDHGQLGDSTTKERHVPVIAGAGPPPEPEVLTGYEEDFDGYVDEAFWGNVIGAEENNITGVAQDGAFKYICNPNKSYWYSVWWKFDEESHPLRYLDISGHPYISFLARVEPGATWNGQPVDEVEIGFDIHGADEYLVQKIPDDGQWHQLYFFFDKNNPAYQHCTEFRLHPGVGDRDATFDPGFVGVVWIDDLRIGDKVQLTPDVMEETFFSEDFDTPADLSFWIPNRETHPDGTPLFFVLQTGEALKIEMRQKNYDDAQLYTFSELGIILNISEEPQARIKMKVEPGATLSGNQMDTVVFALSPFSPDPSNRGGVFYPYSQQHSPVEVAVPADGQWYDCLFDWSRPDTAPAANGYVYPNRYDRVSHILFQTTNGPGELYEMVYWLDDVSIGKEPATYTQPLEEDRDGAWLSCYPNPFRDMATVRFHLPENGKVCLTLHDLTGRTVSVLLQEERIAGIHDVAIDATARPAGIYLLRMESGKEIVTRRVVILK